MKKYYFAILTLTALTFLSGGLKTRAQIVGKTDAPQSLQNEKAIEYLKQTGSYDSLAEAIEDVSPTISSSVNSTFIQHQKLIATDGAADDSFGVNVAVSGDTAVIGAYKDNIGSNVEQGSVYVFVRNGLTWTQQAKLTANDGAAGDNFGIRVSISSDTVIVGSPNSDIGSNLNQGAAYIFVRNGTFWLQQTKIVTGDGADGDEFGWSVGISSETVVIGALFDNVGPNADQGSSYIFVRNGTIWSQQAKLTANDGMGGDNFGTSVAISGGSVIIGSARDTIGSTTDQGSAYVFTRSGTIWTQQTKLTADDGAMGDYFGNSVDLTNTISGTIAVVGARLKDVGGNLGQGAVYVFNRSLSGNWSQTQKLIASDGNSNDGFGVSVAITPISGNAIVIGSWFVSNGGAAYVFKRDGGVWTQRQKLFANDRASGDNFGNSAAISGDTLIIGADRDDVGSNNGQGSSYIFNLGGASPFDFDGDGKTDISIFRPSNGQWWYLKSGNGGNAAFQFGQSGDVLAPADFTGDGKTDITFFRNGTWFVLRSEDSSFFSFPFGASGDIPAPADFDGDGKADPTVFRPSNQTWYISQSTGGTLIVSFGFSEDKPVVADYDGDGKADIAIFRPSVGQWWYLRSSDGTSRAFSFGQSTDKPVQGDYTGDGKADIAFFRPSNGNWYILRSEDSSFFSFPFGTIGDIPAPGDYDGDGKFDPTVFRPSNATWYANRTTDGLLIVGFGFSTDKPIPNAFVP